MTSALPDLVYVNDTEPGITRKKWGRGFIYRDDNGVKIKDEVTINRIKDLVIPPVWQDVWICPTANGHLQCTGLDLKNRKQYIYHPDWVEYNQKNKFSRLKVFGKKLPIIRREIEKDLEQKKWTKTKVLALVVHILDEYYLRIGNQYYTDKNDTYGLTTLRRKHIDETTDGVKLSYKAKSNKQRELTIDDELLSDLIKEMSELPGYEVFRYKEGYRNWTSIDSHDVNEYIKELVSEDFTAKDFRTWGGTKLAVELYPKAKEEVAQNKRLQLEPTLVKLVASRLGNTVATCREYYIHPKVLEELTDDKFSGPDLEKSTEYLDPSEVFILNVISKDDS